MTRPSPNRAFRTYRHVTLSAVSRRPAVLWVAVIAVILVVYGLTRPLVDGATATVGGTPPPVTQVPAPAPGVPQACRDEGVAACLARLQETQAQMCRSVQLRAQQAGATPNPRACPPPPALSPEELAARRAALERQGPPMDDATRERLERENLLRARPTAAP